MAETSTYYRDLTNGSFNSTGAPGMAPVVAPASNPLSAGGRQLPMSGPGASGAPAAPATDPYNAFSQQLLDILKGAQASAKQSRTGLTVAKEGLENSGVNLSNPLAGSPYTSLFQGMSPEASLAAQRGTQAAVQPGVQRIENIMSLNDKNLSDTTALIEAMGNLPVAQRAKMEQDTIFNLAQAYPDANIVPGSDTIQTAQAKVSQAPSFKAKSMQPVVDPITGQTTFVNMGNIPGSSPSGSQPSYQQGQQGAQMPGSGLSRGSQGTEVQQLQTWLVQNGYMSQEEMNTGPGVYGPRTEAAVQKARTAGAQPPMGGAPQQQAVQENPALAGYSPDQKNILQSWAALIKSGGAKLSDVPEKYSGIVAQVVATSPQLSATASNALQQASELMRQITTAESLADMYTTGIGGVAMKNIPSTASYNLARTLDSIQANVGFAALQAMRNASPTGGALGQVTERELALLQATIASLDQGQSLDQFNKNLGIVKLHFNNAVVIAQAPPGASVSFDQQGNAIVQYPSGVTQGARQGTGGTLTWDQI